MLRKHLLEKMVKSIKISLKPKYLLCKENYYHYSLEAFGAIAACANFAQVILT